MSSNAKPETRPARRRVFVDKSLQGQLIVAFVVLEAVILSTAIAYLWWRFGALLDELTFRTHFTAIPDLGTLFLNEGFKVIAACTLVNGAALLAVHWLWNRHIEGMCAQFRLLLQRVTALDMAQASASVAPPLAARYEVLRLADAWVQTERRHLQEIDRALRAIESAGRGDSAAIRDGLDRLDRALAAAGGKRTG